jgi:hypothetical protein
VLGTGGLFQRLPAHRKTFLCFNTQAKVHSLDPELLQHGTLLPTPIPSWATEDAAASRFDDHAAERPFLRDDRAYLASPQGAEGRQEGAIACIAARPDLYRALLDAVSRAGARDGAAVVTVHLVITGFAGRGTGSGGLPVLIGMLDPLRDALAGQVDLIVTVAVQLPTVRVEELALYRTRSAALLAEVSALAELGALTDPDRNAGPWKHRLPWDDFLVFSTGGGRAVQPRGVVTDISEARRYAAAVLYERLAGEAGTQLTALAPLRARLLLARDQGTSLPRLFGATGVAELVYEPDAAVEHGTAYLEQSFYEAVRTKDAERN